MVDLVFQDILATIAHASPADTLQKLQVQGALFLDSLDGITLHAEALYAAIKKTNYKAVEYLLSLPVHSDIAFFKFCGNTPIGLAVEENRSELLDTLLKKSDKNFALLMAVKLGQAKVKELLMRDGNFKGKFLKLLSLK